MRIDKDVLAAFVTANPITQNKCLEIYNAANGLKSRAKPWTKGELDKLADELTEGGTRLKWKELSELARVELCEQFERPAEQIRRAIWKLHRDQT